MDQFLSRLRLFALCFLALSLSESTLAQHELSSFTSTGRGVASPFVEDYHALGINASNLDWESEFEGKRVTFGFAEIAGSLYSEAFVKEDLRRNLFGGNFDELTRQQKLDMIKEFTDAGTSLDLNYMWAGVGVRTNALGGFSYTTRDNISFNSHLSEDIATIMYLGGTAPYFEQLILASGDTIANNSDVTEEELSQVTEGITSLENAQSFSDLLGDSEVSLSWTREFHIGYGKRILNSDDFQLYVGGGFKYIIGQGMVRLGKNADGEIESFSALTPAFGIDYGDGEDANPSQLPETAGNFEPVGWGWGIDLGASVILKEKLRLAFSVTDIGRMNWDGNVYTLEDFDLTNLTDTGLETNSIYEQLETFTDPNGLLSWTGETKVQTKLPTQIRAGARFDINEKLRIGAEGVFAANDELSQLEQPVLAFGGDITPLPFLRISLGFINGGNYDFKIPAGITLMVGNGSWEVGVASRDMITYFSENQPTLSASFGFLRFRI